MPKISLKFKEQVLKEIPLDKPRLAIGRKPDNDLVIDDPGVSGHHALIFSEEGVFFIEDLGSTNGTFVNDAKIQKEKLKISDRVAVGAHVLIYQEEVAPTLPLPREAESDKTMRPEPAKQEEPVKAVPETAKTAAAEGKKAEKVGRLTVVSGETDRKAYELTGHLTVIGAEDTATVRLTGWFAPKNAALISLKGSTYVISQPEGGKKITVNGEAVLGKKPLHDGDLIIIAGVHFQFSLK
jgi:pSer/pThr/pTyr-binding forkhead associated (FHA) protein